MVDIVIKTGSGGNNENHGNGGSNEIIGNGGNNENMGNGGTNENIGNCGNNENIDLGEFALPLQPEHRFSQFN